MEQPNQENFEGLDLTKLPIDTAYVRLQSVPETFYVYLVEDDCYRCPFKLSPAINKNKLLDVEDNVFKISTHHPWNLRIRNEDSMEYVSQFINDKQHIICETKAHFGAFGVYDVNVTNECNITTMVEPVNGYLAILYCTLILIGLGIIFHIAKWSAKRKYFTKLEKVYKLLKRQIGYEIEMEDMSSKKNNNKMEEENSKSKSRVKSLDTFRGITIALMIFVNDGAGGYWFFEHATWNGLQLADVVFPWFLWIMGVCIPMSMKSFQKRKVPKGVALIGILRRSLVLFLLGFFWNTIGWIDLEKLRIPGVLQRFSITYFVVATTGVVFLEALEPKCVVNQDNNKMINVMKDMLCLWPRWIVAAIFLIAPCLLTFMLKVPGCPTGYLGPSGLYNDNETLGVDCVGGAAGYIDRQFFGINHIYSNPTSKAVYESGAFDPEGLLGSLTSVVQVFLGYQAGQIIMTYKNDMQRIIRLISWGLVTGLIGFALNGTTRDEGLIPINKNLWSLSYVFVTTGMAFLLMAFVYVLVDFKHVWQGEPFLFAGMNSIVLYLGHYTAWQMAPFNYISGPMNTHWAKLVESIWGTCAWLIVAYILFRKKVFITV